MPRTDFAPPGTLWDARRRGHFFAILGGKISPPCQIMMCYCSSLPPGLPDKIKTKARNGGISQKEKQVSGSYASFLVSTMNMPWSGHGLLSRPLWDARRRGHFFVILGGKISPPCQIMLCYCSSLPRGLPDKNKTKARKGGVAPRKNDKYRDHTRPFWSPR